MRPLAIIGIVLILVGGWVTINGGSFTTRETVVDIGDLEITADRERPIPLWAGILAIVAGAGMVAAGARKR
jgi:hypothetical protein